VFTVSRKNDHIRICLERPVEFKKTNGFERYELVHHALPEMDLDKIDLSTRFLGKKFSAPLFIEAMTGGSPETEKINKNLAEAAEKTGIGMGVGSQRAALENPRLTYTYNVVRDVAPHIFLLGNLGAVQILKYDIDQIKKAVEMINADGLAIHFNAAQEVVQKEGNKEWYGVLEKIKHVCSSVDFPIIAKETGCGISARTAKMLEHAGVKAIDVAGAGGTSWAKVEYYRGSSQSRIFSEWGIPTAESLCQCVKTVKIPVIASGGIRNGIEVAKALAMGGSLAGLALPLLKPATQSWKAVKERLDLIITELKTTMFLTGAKNIEELKKVGIVKI
jgi:isopentenyl-diphosphate delta-isomerase